MLTVYFVNSQHFQIIPSFIFQSDNELPLVKPKQTDPWNAPLSGLPVLNAHQLKIATDNSLSLRSYRQTIQLTCDLHVRPGGPHAAVY